MVASVLTDNTGTTGEVNITWTDAEKPANFYAWRVYQRATSDTFWTKVYETFTDTTSYDIDTYAWANLVQQEMIVIGVSQDPSSGVLTETAYTGANTFTPTGDTKYTLVHPTDPAKTVQINVTTADRFTIEDDHQVIPLLGDDAQTPGGYKINKGNLYAQVGSLTVSIYDHPTLGTAAVQLGKLQDLHREGNEVFLRDPFGNMLKIFVGKLDISRLAGVGTSESVEGLDIPYTEVI